MRKMILTTLDAALLAGTASQVVTTAENHRSHKIYRAPAAANERLRNANNSHALYPHGQTRFVALKDMVRHPRLPDAEDKFLPDSGRS